MGRMGTPLLSLVRGGGQLASPPEPRPTLPSPELPTPPPEEGDEETNPALATGARVLSISASDVHAVMVGGRSPGFAPEVREGKLVGIRLSRVQPNSAAERLGAQNGDVIQTVNGVELTSYAAVAETEASTQEARRFVVHLTRGGKPMTLILELDVGL